MSNKIFIGLCILAFLIVVFVPAPAKASDGFYLEAGVSKNGIFQPEWEGRDEVGALLGFGYVWHIHSGDSGDLYLDAAYRHSSQWATGIPFNDDSEDYLDSVGIIFRLFL